MGPTSTLKLERDRGSVIRTQPEPVAGAQVVGLPLRWLQTAIETNAWKQGRDAVRRIKARCDGRWQN